LLIFKLFIWHSDWLCSNFCLYICIGLLYDELARCC